MTYMTNTPDQNHLYIDYLWMFQRLNVTTTLNGTLF